MAEVFKASKAGAKGFKKTFALKRILPPFSDKKHFTNMLFDEAHLQAQLNHPNLVQVYDFAHDQEQYYLIMEYVDGISLRDLSRQLWARHEKIPWQVSLYTISQMLKALQYIHHKKNESESLNIVHRDVSPQNILLARNGQVKLADFGIAWSTLKQEQTRSGVLKGKTSYLSPQQLNNTPITAFTDIFATAIILYELICQRNPFLGQSDYATMKNIEDLNYINSKQLAPDVPQNIHQLLNSILSCNDLDLSAQDMLMQINAIQENDWLLNGDILFTTWLEQQSLITEDSKHEALDKTIFLTHPHTQTHKTKISKKTPYFVLFFTTSLLVIVLWHQGYFQEKLQHKTPQQVLDKKKPPNTAKQSSTPVAVAKPVAKNNKKKPQDFLKKRPLPSSKKLSKVNFIGPEGSTIVINGEHKQILPAHALKLEAGTYLVQWTLKTGQNKIKRIQLKEDSTKILLWHSF
ncbi:serine/threonine protein kinase [bacterium]|nr:serine/threonine protein kinase [bacterium]